MNEQPGRYRIGVGAGFGGDRMEPAAELARHAQLDALVFECLAERTIAVAQTGLRNGSSTGFDDRMLDRFRLTLPELAKRGGVAITNAGAANPIGGALATRELLDELGLDSLKVAAVTGDDVLDKLDFSGTEILGTEERLSDYESRIVSANAYVGASGVLEALDGGADVVVGGRVGDASLFTGALLHHFSRGLDDLDFLAEATLVGHMLECGGQLTGGYFADGVKKKIKGLSDLGFPFADVAADGAATFGKLAHQGGELTVDTVREQLYYEIDDPRRYLTPDLAVDLSQVSVAAGETDSVSVRGARPLYVPETLKVSIGIEDGCIAIAEISYAGAFAMERAELARAILEQRWRALATETVMPEFYYIGVNSARPWFVADQAPSEVRLRATLRTFDRSEAVRLCREVEALYTNGPAGGGGVTGSVRETIGIVSALVPAEFVQQKVTVF